jgi:hypothetical protein
VNALPEIEYFHGRFWFTAWTPNGGIVRGPFATHKEAEAAKKEWETSCQTTIVKLTS